MSDKACIQDTPFPNVSTTCFVVLKPFYNQLMFWITVSQLPYYNSSLLGLQKISSQLTYNAYYILYLCAQLLSSFTQKYKFKSGSVPSSKTSVILRDLGSFFGLLHSAQNHFYMFLTWHPLPEMQIGKVARTEPYWWCAKCCHGEAWYFPCSEQILCILA